MSDFTFLDQTFKSRPQAEKILRPYLESGVITEHDFGVAVNFLPGNHRYWPMAYSTCATLLTVAYGRWRTPRWTPGRSFTFGLIANVVGLTYGQARRIYAHAKFVRSLENSDGFVHALQDIAAKNGGPSVLNVLSRRPETNAGDDAPAKNMDRNNGYCEDSSPPATRHPESSIANDRKVLSRWDEIRAANASGPKSTSWDVLRQQHDSNNGGRDKSSSEQDPSIQHDDQAERMQEQARFDALLEAERRLSQA